VLHHCALGLAALAASAAAFTHSASGAHRARAQKFDGSNSRQKFLKDAYILQVDASTSGLAKRGTSLASVSTSPGSGGRAGGCAVGRGAGRAGRGFRV